MKKVLFYTILTGFFLQSAGTFCTEETQTKTSAIIETSKMVSKGIFEALKRTFFGGIVPVVSGLAGSVTKMTHAHYKHSSIQGWTFNPKNIYF